MKRNMAPIGVSERICSNYTEDALNCSETNFVVFLDIFAKQASKVSLLLSHNDRQKISEGSKRVARGKFYQIDVFKKH